MDLFAKVFDVFQQRRYISVCSLPDLIPIHQVIPMDKIITHSYH